MNDAFETWLQRLALGHLYLADAAPAAPAHCPVWLCPFQIVPPDASPEETERRVVLAGALWLRNLDLSFAPQLTISHVERPWSMIFQRGQRPGEDTLHIGPFGRRLIMRGGTPLPNVPFVYRESLVSHHRDAWRELLAQREASP